MGDVGGRLEGRSSSSSSALGEAAILRKTIRGMISAVASCARSSSSDSGEPLLRTLTATRTKRTELGARMRILSSGEPGDAQHDGLASDSNEGTEEPIDQI